ncbi:MAG: NAD-dependent epimerase/dehydratase family protein, partial [Patescibacteria group bacterium]
MISNKKNKTVLITGGAGFLGYHIIEYILEETNWKIEILDSLNYAGNMNRMVELIFGHSKNKKDSISKRIKFVWHDLRAPISLTTHKLLGKIDYCIHTAAESHVDRSLEDSVPFISSNV